METRFCPETCRYLSLTEEKQQETGNNNYHRCLLYCKRLYHQEYHPNIVRLNMCEIDD
jgi:hypothetical protein